MAWYSILPSHLSFIETWIIRICVALAFINLAPWLIAIVYDIILYICRSIWHELPIYGGRARGEIRPRAPSMRDRSRRMSLAELIGGHNASMAAEPGVYERKNRQNRHQRNTSSESIEEMHTEGSDGES